ncbi:MAG: ABC transporter permease [Haloarculaceae archaeon]
MSTSDRLRELSRGEYGVAAPFLRGRGVLAVLGALLGAYLVLPFVAFFTWIDGLTLASFADPEVLGAIEYSLATAPVSTALATVFGVPLAYVLARSSFPGKPVVDALVVLPLVLPPVVGGVMLLTAFGRFTVIGGLFAGLGLPLTDSYLGIVLAQTFVASPFLVITARAGFASIDRDLERAARSLGKGPLETFRRVSLPMARGSILAGIVLSFTRAMGEFGATMMTAYHPGTMPTQIWGTFIGEGVAATAPLVITLVAIGFAVVLAITWLNELDAFGPGS